MWEIALLEPVEQWFLRLCEEDPETANRVTDALDHLASAGPNLGRPMVDRIHHSRLHNLKELRPGSSGRGEVRMLFVFDATREAVILVAGDKAGRWNLWYEENIPLAETRYAEYVAARELREQGGDR
ncbi:type II toxin-antitoxin system RelE/ParE family toxin [Streptomyces sp. B1866]|uniref:type II toxin-antitoxin system RelE/ParE family toxin n=1 Tax=Streptomyces sp. B1866 TaxID=3075431 RepID=UPI00288DBAAD|nr:type II toxin-antitoxin system RelE/ParE family toxin [Streptomyces sp. B1866]MDT3397937.1 type II toxin-antitoxin system RelE/ParE family toxin [Streptomyces sp. B1866]